ncbi:hypothetical protein [Shewanella sp. 0m-4]
MKTIQLTFNQVTATITSNEDGMYALNDIHRAFGLSKTNAPSQWRSDTASRLRDSANLHSERHGKTQHLVATQKALYAYAMWCDYDFYDAVLDAFTAITNGDIAKTISIARSVADVQGERASELYGKPYFAMKDVAAVLQYTHVPTANKLCNHMVVMKKHEVCARSAHALLDSKWHAHVFPP